MEVSSDSEPAISSNSRHVDENNMLWIPIQSVNPHLICGLCQGYLYEACTITECMHSFCKNCIVKHLERSLNCPMCAILIHPTDPFVHIRLDGLLQDIVYALLPHVEKEELEREGQFYKKHNKATEYLSQRERVRSEFTGNAFTPPTVPAERAATHRNVHQPAVSLCIQCLEPGDFPHQLKKQFVQVTGGATIRSLTTFLRKKLCVEDSAKVDVYCPCRSGYVCLNNSHTLKDVKDLYCHDQEILHLNYDISEQ